METAEAKFIAMFVERLNALEEKNMALEQQNERLKSQMSEMKSCLHLRDNLMTFNDGQVLRPAFGQGECTLVGPEVLSYQSDIQDKPLDPLHANAVAFHGRLSFDFGFEEWPHKLVLGKEDEWTTVKEYLQGMDDWCKDWVAKEPDTAVTQTLSMQGSFLGWHRARIDFANNVTTYSLK